MDGVALWADLRYGGRYLPKSASAYYDYVTKTYGRLAPRLLQAYPLEDFNNNPLAAAVQVREPIAGGRRAYAQSGNQSRAGGRYIPGAETNRGQEEGIWPEREPIAGGRRAYTRSGNQSRAGRGYIPGVETNRGREEGVYPEREPIAGGKRVYTRSGNQSRAGGGYIPGAGTNRGREEDVTNARFVVQFQEPSIYIYTAIAASSGSDSASNSGKDEWPAVW
eukprot:941954-Pyramimonas_sp.AAC.1